MDTYISLGLIVLMLGGVWLVMRGINVPIERRVNPDFYRVYNEQEDRTETMFDRRDH